MREFDSSEGQLQHSFVSTERRQTWGWCSAASGTYHLPVPDWVCNGTLRLWLERDVCEFLVMVYEFFVSCQIMRYCPGMRSDLHSRLAWTLRIWGFVNFSFRGLLCRKGRPHIHEGLGPAVFEIDNSAEYLGVVPNNVPVTITKRSISGSNFLSTLTLAHLGTWSMAALGQVFLLQHWCRGFCVTPSFGLWEIAMLGAWALTLWHWRCVARAVWRWCCTGWWDGLPV